MLMSSAGGREQTMFCFALTKYMNLGKCFSHLTFAFALRNVEMKQEGDTVSFVTFSLPTCKNGLYGEA